MGDRRRDVDELRGEIQELFADSVEQRYETLQINLNNYWRGYWPKHPVQVHLHGLPEDVIVKVISDSDEIRFVDGHGWGHGVGFCQWCSQRRAEEGLRHEDIVLAAFPRAKLVRAY